MATFYQKKTALEWMINHYQECADKCWNTYNDLLSFYVIYDYNISKVEEYTKMLNVLTNQNL